MPDPLRDKPSRSWTRGSALIELAMFLSVGVPLLLGLTSVGIRLGRGIQATQVTRDVGHMYALGADFTLSGTQSIARTLATGFDLTATGNSVLTLSRITKVSQTDCTAAGLNNCPNLDQPVFTQRIVIGDANLRAGNYGTPPPQYIGTQGNIAASDYCKQSALIATGFANVITLAEDQVTWLVEGYFSMPDLNPLGGNNGGVYVRLVF
ncbi:MAG TPA: hypothetical protein VMJ75_27955 [Candidatus Acidoferrales bacterium]|nr:hypothetical protein [Candidatus Acidoferrales bacterium]